MTVAFDADAVIYAGQKDNTLGNRVAALFAAAPPSAAVGTGSVLLLNEVLAKPMRDDPDSDETPVLASLLSRVELWPLDEARASWPSR